MQLLKTIITWLIYTFIFLLPWQTRLIYQYGELNGQPWEGGNQALYGTELLLGIIFILCIIYLIGNRKLWSKNNAGRGVRLSVAAGVFLCLLIPVLFSINKDFAIYNLSQIIMAIALVFTILMIKPDQRKAMFVIVLSGFIQSLLAIYQFISQTVFASKWLGMAGQTPEIPGVPVVMNNGERLLRVFGSLPQPNILAGFLTIAIIITVILLATGKSRREAAFLYAALTVNTVALYFTASRSALVTLLISLILLLLYKLKTRHKLPTESAVRNATILILILFAILNLSWPGYLSGRLNTADRLNQTSTSERLAGYHDALPVLKSYWLTGTGPGNYALALFRQSEHHPNYYYQPLHNAIILPFLEFGIWNLGFWILTIFIFKKIKSRLFESPTTAGLSVVMVSILIISLFDHYFYTQYFGLILTAVTCALFFQGFEDKQNITPQ